MKDSIITTHNEDGVRTGLVVSDGPKFLGVIWPDSSGVRVNKVEKRTARITVLDYNLNKASRSVEIGYDLHPAYWRQGIMTEALRAVIDYGFSEEFCFWLNRIEALTYVEHEASAGLLRKLGFQEEGIRREYGYWKGESHDLRSFSLLRRDWEASSTADWE